MKDERLMILTMLQEEKISSEEAAKLLEALEEAELKDSESLSRKDAAAGDLNTPHQKDKDRDDFKSFEKDFDRNMEDLDKRLQKMGKKMEIKGEVLGEKMGKLGEDIADSATSFTDKVVDFVENIIDKNNFDGFLWSNYKTIVETQEKDLSGISNPVLEFEAINGKIIVSPWDENKVKVKATCHVKKNKVKDDEIIYEVIEHKGKICFKPRIVSGIGIKLEVFLPEKTYERINLMTTNGRIIVKDIHSDYLLLDTTNSSVLIEDIQNQEMKISTKNGKVVMQDVQSKIISATTTNSSILLEDVACEKIDVSTSNGKIVTNDLATKVSVFSSTNGSITLEDLSSNDITAKTSNGSIIVNDIDTDTLNFIDLSTTNAKVEVSFTNTDANFDIEAKTSIGNIDIDFPLVYEVNNQKSLGNKRIKAHSVDNDNRKVNVNISTSNGSIRISE